MKMNNSYYSSYINHKMSLNIFVSKGTEKDVKRKMQNIQNLLIKKIILVTNPIKLYL